MCRGYAFTSTGQTLIILYRLASHELFGSRYCRSAGPGSDCLISDNAGSFNRRAELPLFSYLPQPTRRSHGHVAAKTRVSYCLFLYFYGASPLCRLDSQRGDRGNLQQAVKERQVHILGISTDAPIFHPQTLEVSSLASVRQLIPALHLSPSSPSVAQQPNSTEQPPACFPTSRVTANLVYAWRFNWPRRLVGSKRNAQLQHIRSLPQVGELLPPNPRYPDFVS